MNTDKKNEPNAVEPVAVEERPTREPLYEITETADEFVVTVQVPGVERSGVETMINGDELVITGKRTWHQPESWQILHEEIPVADYRLVLRLDHRVNRDALKAHLRDGILSLMIPKAEAVKPRRIEIAS